MGAIAEFLAQLEQAAEDDERILRETHEYSLRKRQERWQKQHGIVDEMDEDDDDHDVSVHYEP